MRGRRFGLFLLGLCLTFPVLPFPAVAGRTEDVADVRSLYQDPFFYIRGNPWDPLLARDELERLRDPFDAKYFSPWEKGHFCKARDVLEWVFRYVEAREGYGQNLRALPSGWFERLRIQSDIESSGEIGLPAISVVSTSLRLLPTEEPFFLDPGEPGEGYPFDYLQNSGVHPGEPLFLSHYSLDGDWAFVETSYASGWMSVRDFALAGEDFRREWRAWSMSALRKDGLVLKDRQGHFLSRGSIGTLLPLLGQDGRSCVLAVPRRGDSGEAVMVEALCPAGASSPFPLQLTAWNLTRVASEMTGQSYGWGGFLGKRDCSATVRDIFLPFGIWLPRNSAAQARAGTFVSFEGMERSEKEETLLRDGVPFTTLVAMRGHIMLYVGQRRGRPLVLHNTWGLRTCEEGKEGRHIIGKTVITTLTPGKELPALDPDRGLLIDRVTGMTLLCPGKAGRP